MGDFAAFNAVYAKYFTSNPVLCSCVAVKTLPKNALCEIEAAALSLSFDFPNFFLLS